MAAKKKPAAKKTVAKGPEAPKKTIAFVTVQGGDSPSGRRNKRKEEARQLMADTAEERDALAAAVADALPTITKTIDRVRFIADEMVSGRWNGFESREPLSAAWKLSDERIRNLAAEAHRMVSYDPQELLERRRALAGLVSRIHKRASEMTSWSTGLPDFTAALKAIELEAKFIGIEIEPTRKVELSGSAGGPISVSLDDVDAALKAADDNASPEKDPGIGG